MSAAREEKRQIRMIGSGHSFTPVAAANDIMLTPYDFKEVRQVDAANGLITIDAGIDLTRLCHVLDDNGLALTNMGDIRVQTIGGAIQTSTHGTGKASGTFAQMVQELELVTGTGEIVTVNRDSDPELFNAARVGLGAVGIITAVTLKVEPSFRLHAHEFPSSFEETVGSFDKWTDTNDHVEFFWFPHTEDTLVKHNNRTYDPAAPVSKRKAWYEDEFLSNKVFNLTCKVCRAAPGYTPFVNRLAGKLLSERTYTDVSWKVLTSPRTVKFEEMEYALPRAAGLAALREVKKFLDNGPWRISFPIEFRSVPADEAWLSTASERDTAYLACHVFQRTDREWFREVEAILRGYDGRPHWGKLHTRTAADLAPAYPHFNDFLAVRDRVDPDRIFANDYTRQVLGE